MSIYNKIKYSIREEDLFKYEINEHGVKMGQWTPYLIKLLSDVVDYLDSLPSEFKEEYMFIDGEFDSNQTEFERKSNYIEIGAKSMTNVGGYVLLAIMRMIIDDHPCYFLDNLKMYVDDNPEDEDWISKFQSCDLTLEQIVKVLKEAETQYTTSTPISEEAKQTLMGWDSKLDKIKETYISKKAAEIDLWDGSRVKSVLKKMIKS